MRCSGVFRYGATARWLAAQEVLEVETGQRMAGLQSQRLAVGFLGAGHVEGATVTVTVSIISPTFSLPLTSRGDLLVG